MNAAISHMSRRHAVTPPSYPVKQDQTQKSRLCNPKAHRHQDSEAMAAKSTVFQ
jgi:hypothetical protein